MQKLEHSPRLSTIRMVEDTLEKAQESIVTVSQLKRILPKQVNHNTLITILEYLGESNKIAVSIKGITWIHNTNPALANAINKGIMH